MSMSSGGTAMQIGGLAEQDISSFLTGRKAYKDQKLALEKAQRETEKGYTEAATYIQPQYQQGMEYYSSLGDMIKGGSFNTDVGNFTYPTSAESGVPSTFNYSGQDLTSDPGYQFRLQEGTNAVQGSAAAKGSALSGATLKALAKYGQNYASNEYQNAYNRAYQTWAGNTQQYNTNRQFAYNTFSDLYNRQNQQNTQRYNMYSQMANTGIAAGNTLANQRLAQAEDLANLEIQRGNVKAAAYMDMRNSFQQQGQHLFDIGSGMGGKVGNSGGSSSGSSGSSSGGLGGLSSFNIGGSGSSGGSSSGGMSQIDMNTLSDVMGNYYG